MLYSTTGEKYVVLVRNYGSHISPLQGVVRSVGVGQCGPKHSTALTTASGPSAHFPPLRGEFAPGLIPNLTTQTKSLGTYRA